MPVSTWLSPWLTRASLTRHMHYQKGLESSPTKQGYITRLGSRWPTEAGSMRQAHYRRALEIQPRNAVAHNQLGMVLAGQGRLDEALANYQKAWKSSRSMPWPTTTSAMSWPRGASSRRPPHIIGRPWKFSLATRWPTAAWPGCWRLLRPVATKRRRSHRTGPAGKSTLGRQPEMLDALAAAYAAAGWFPEAVATARQALNWPATK